ncbi:MAG TPA: hypothetical protein DDZ89_14030, partial [Clostridiales bacterium]|nr:hypothetical protein [Clostridiales bacterium]
YIEHLKQYKYLPAPQYTKKTTHKNAGRILDLAEFMKGSYDGQPARSQSGFCYINTYGKGKSVYFAGTTGQLLIEMHFPEYVDLTGKMIKNNADAKVRVSNVPASVSINVRQNEQGDILLYLLNYTGPMIRPITDIVELSNIQIEVDFKVDNAKTLYIKDNCILEQKEGKCHITVNKLKEFEVIVLQKN